LIEHGCSTVRDLLLAFREASRKPTAAKLITALTGAAPDWEDALRRNLSGGKAAQLAGMQRLRFGEELAARNIPRHYTEENLRQNLAE
jgi:hypothetical protein